MLELLHPQQRIFLASLLNNNGEGLVFPENTRLIRVLAKRNELLNFKTDRYLIAINLLDEMGTSSAYAVLTTKLGIQNEEAQDDIRRKLKGNSYWGVDRGLELGIGWLKVQIKEYNRRLRRAEGDTAHHSAVYSHLLVLDQALNTAQAILRVREETPKE